MFSQGKYKNSLKKQENIYFRKNICLKKIIKNTYFRKNSLKNKKY